MDLTFITSLSPYSSATFAVNVKGCLNGKPSYPCLTVVVNYNFIGCDTTVITTTQVSDKAYYKLAPIVEILSIPEFEESFEICGAFTYSAKASTDGGVTYGFLPTYLITFDPILL